MEPKHETWLAVIAKRVSTSGERRRIVGFTRELERFIDAYSSRYERADSRVQSQRGIDVISFYRAHSESIEAALLLACANLTGCRMPGNIYPGMLLHELIRDVRGRPLATPSTKLLERVCEAAPHEWAVFEASVISLERGPRSGWPDARIAAQTLEALDALRSPWTQIEAETREQYRADWYRKDPAHRRALGWLQLCTWVLSGLASSTNGPLRLFVDYVFGLLRYFELRAREPRTVSPNKAMCDVLVLEVFEVAYNYAELADVDGVEPRLTRGSYGHDGCKLRKRVQRARLNSVLRRHTGAKLLVSDQLWSEWLRPQLESLAARP